MIAGDGPSRDILVRHQALPAERITAVETGGCPHTAVRDDCSQSLDALEQLMLKFNPQARGVFLDQTKESARSPEYDTNVLSLAPAPMIRYRP